MYKVYVTKVKNIRKAENADKLNLCEVFGNTVVVDKNVNETDLYVYFPIDGQISIKFGEKNNLFRKKDENGNSIGGFIDPDKRNIRALRLRGNKSEGLLMPLTSLVEFGDISTLKQGDTVEIFNGVQIAEKYVPKVIIKESKRNNNNQKSEKAVKCKLFKEHIDTEQLNYNLGAFKVGDLVELTLKMHGCFVTGTKVRTQKGLKEIQTIKVGDKVLGYNHNTKKIEETEVLQVFHNDRSDKWRELKFSRNRLAGDKRGTIKCTPNHPFWVEEKEKYVFAEDLRVGDIVSTLFPSLILSDIQKQIAIGMLLGDGCLQSFDDRVAELQSSSKKEHEAYQDFLQDVSSGLYYKGAKEYKSGYGTQMIRGRTKRTADLYNFLKGKVTFNNTGRKLCDGLIEAFTPLSAAIFYMDDGSLSHSDKQHDRANIAICDYDKEDSQIIIKCFNKLELYPVYYVDAQGYSRLRFNKDEANKMWDLIEGYIPEVMQYKLPKERRGQKIKIIDQEGGHHDGYVLSPQEVLQNDPLIEVHAEFDMETKLHNYVVGLSIVHNTSGRTAYLPVQRKLPQNKIQKFFKMKPKFSVTNEYISGTRRTVIQESQGDAFTGGFYGSDNFRKTHHNTFVDKLSLGETVYYEIVGYTDCGGAIMASGVNKKVSKEFEKQYGKITEFSYGCDPEGVNAPKSDLYVYRITMTTEDGRIIEYSPTQIQVRCEELGVKSVPVFETFQIKDEDLYALESEITNEYIYETPGEYVKKMVDKYVDGPDPIGKTHVREGVVVRILNRNGFKVYKDKNYDFKVLSGIITESVSEKDTIDETVLEEM